MYEVLFLFVKQDKIFANRSAVITKKQTCARTTPLYADWPLLFGFVDVTQHVLFLLTTIDFEEKGRKTLRENSCLSGRNGWGVCDVSKNTCLLLFSLLLFTIKVKWPWLVTLFLHTFSSLYSQRERKNIETTSIKASFSTTTVS
jgi:hypothetical protein